MSIHLLLIVEDMGLHMDCHLASGVVLASSTSSMARYRLAKPHNRLAAHLTQSVSGAPQMDRFQHGKVRKRLLDHGENLIDAQVCRRHVNALNMARLVLQPGRHMLHVRIRQILQNETDERFVISAGDILERQGDVLHGRGADQHDHLSLANTEIVEHEIVLYLHGAVREHVGLLILVAIEDVVHVALHVEQGGARLDSEEMLLDAAEVAVNGDADLVREQRGELEGESAKHGCEVIRGVRCLLFLCPRFSIFGRRKRPPHPLSLEDNRHLFHFFLRVRRARLDFLE